MFIRNYFPIGASPNIPPTMIIRTLCKVTERPVGQSPGLFATLLLRWLYRLPPAQATSIKMGYYCYFIANCLENRKKNTQRKCNYQHNAHLDTPVLLHDPKNKYDRDLQNASS